MKTSDDHVVAAEELALYHDRVMDVLRPLPDYAAHLVLDSVRTSLRKRAEHEAEEDR